MSTILTNANPVMESVNDPIPEPAEPAAGPTPAQITEELPSVTFTARMLNGAVQFQLNATIPGEPLAQRLAGEYAQHWQDLVDRRFMGIAAGFARSAVLRERAALLGHRDELSEALAQTTETLGEHERAYRAALHAGQDFRPHVADKAAAEVECQRLRTALGDLNLEINAITTRATQAWRTVLTEALARLQVQVRSRQVALLCEVARLVADRVPEAEVCRAVSYLSVDVLTSKYGQLPQDPSPCGA